MVSSLALLAVASCKKHDEPATPPAPTNSEPSQAAPGGNVPPAPGGTVPDTNNPVPMTPANTNQSAVTNQ
jgi:hypothetical protein